MFFETNRTKQPTVEPVSIEMADMGAPKPDMNLYVRAVLYSKLFNLDLDLSITHYLTDLSNNFEDLNQFKLTLRDHITCLSHDELSLFGTDYLYADAQQTNLMNLSQRQQKLYDDLITLCPISQVYRI